MIYSGDSGSGLPSSARIPARDWGPDRALRAQTNLGKAEGYSYRGCADRLTLSLDTVRFSIRRIYERLHVHSKSQAVKTALKRGLVL